MSYEQTNRAPEKPIKKIIPKSTYPIIIVVVVGPMTSAALTIILKSASKII